MLRILTIICFVLTAKASVIPQARIGSSSNIPLSYDEYFGCFFGQISMGSPPQVLNVVVDTQSPHFYVVSDKCNSSQCLLCQVVKYESEKSTTYNTTGQVVQFFDQCSTNEGYISSDLIQIGEIILEAQEFLEASLVRYGIDPNAYSGVLGLALGESSTPKLRTVPEHLLQSKAATQFSLHFDSRKSGQLTFGNSMQDPVVSVPVSDPNNWQFISDQISVGDEKFCGSTGCKVNIDSRSKFVSVPESVGNRFIKAIHAIILPGPGTIFVPAPEIPKVPNLDINVNGQILSLNITDYSICEPGYCVVLLDSSETEEWTFGLPLLFKYDTEFNFADKTISFESKK